MTRPKLDAKRVTEMAIAIGAMRVLYPRPKDWAEAEAMWKHTHAEDRDVARRQARYVLRLLADKEASR